MQAINTVVTVAEILKKQGVAKIKSIQTSQISVGHPPKPKISIFIQKGDKYHEVDAEKEKLTKENQEINELLKQKQQQMQERLKKEEEARSKQ